MNKIILVSAISLFSVASVFGYRIYHNSFQASSHVEQVEQKIVPKHILFNVFENK